MTDDEIALLDANEVIELVRELEANQVTSEYDEDTGYCLCPCCRHGV